MRVLWITNIIFPAIAEKLNLPNVVFGGWMYSSAKTLLDTHPNVKLAVATVYNGTEYVVEELCGILYFLLPDNKKNSGKCDKELEKYWKDVNKYFTPQLVHIHGTECPYGLSFLRACPNVPAIASIQGIISRITRYYLAGMSNWDIFKSLTFRDIFRGTIWAGKRHFEKSACYEIETIRRLNHIIGRTSWDKAHALTINPNINYHFCNETLRDAFYDKTWSYEDCEKYSIFISQAAYPVKGLHQLLKAMPFILNQFPETRIYIAGIDITRSKDGIRGKLLQTGYGCFLSRLIKQYGLEHNVIFTGSLNEGQMCQRYLSSNVFVCPSSIENSPNSLGEAQILGVPCVAAYVGGIPDMMVGDEDNLYRFEEYEMLANKVCDIFATCRKPNIDMRRRALTRHDKNVNSLVLYSIYKELI